MHFLRQHLLPYNIVINLCRRFSVLEVASIYANLLEQKKRLRKKRVQLPQDWFGTPQQHGRRFIVLGHQYGRRDVM